MTGVQPVPYDPAATGATGATGPRTVLVADDYPAMLAWASRAFQRAGWTVLTAVDGQEALARWGEAQAAGLPVAVLVTDLELPGLDGASLARSLRAHDPGLPVLAMHAGEGTEAAWRGPLPDRTAFFEKPMRAAELVATAAALADARSSAAVPALDEPCPVERLA